MFFSKYPNSDRGFTIIELLVVIAIISILAGLALTNMRSARNSGNDSTIIQNLTNARSEAQYYGQVYNSGSYDGVCDSTSEYSLQPFIDSAIEAGNGNVVCVDNDNNWAIEAELSNGTYFCISEIEVADIFSDSANLSATQTECVGTPA